MLVSPDPTPAPPMPIAVPPAPSAPPAPPATVRADDLGTRMLSGAPTRSPRASRRHREQGPGVLALTLDVDGSVASISVAPRPGFRRSYKPPLGPVRKCPACATSRSRPAGTGRGL